VSGVAAAGSTARLVLLIGSPRSGTTWTQAMLGSHPRIATPQETDMLHVFIAPLADAWDRQLLAARDERVVDRRKGLPLVLTDAEFTVAAGALVRATVDAVTRMKPGADVVVEKSPIHSLHVSTALRFVPEVSFVHVLRDGRDVAHSLVTASRAEWGSRWAPTTITEAANTWESHVSGARSAHARSARFCEVRYEELTGDDAADALVRAFAGCGVQVTNDEARATLERFRLEDLRADGEVAASIVTGGELAGAPHVRVEPDGFFRRGGSGEWRTAWSAADRREFDSAAGELLVSLGYEPDHAWADADR
jgi:hypothetical protein